MHIPYAIERDENGAWCASAHLQPGVGAFGDGDTAQEALDDLREALFGLVDEVGLPPMITLELP